MTQAILCHSSDLVRSTWGGPYEVRDPPWQQLGGQLVKSNIFYQIRVGYKSYVWIWYTQVQIQIQIRVQLSGIYVSRAGPTDEQSSFWWLQRACKELRKALQWEVQSPGRGAQQKKRCVKELRDRGEVLTWTSMESGFGVLGKIFKILRGWLLRLHPKAHQCVAILLKGWNLCDFGSTFWFEITFHKDLDLKIKSQMDWVLESNLRRIWTCRVKSRTRRSLLSGGKRLGGSMTRPPLAHLCLKVQKS